MNELSFTGMVTATSIRGKIDHYIEEFRCKGCAGYPLTPKKLLADKIVSLFQATHTFPTTDEIRNVLLDLPDKVFVGEIMNNVDAIAQALSKLYGKEDRPKLQGNVTSDDKGYEYCECKRTDLICGECNKPLPQKVGEIEELEMLDREDYLDYQNYEQSLKINEIIKVVNNITKFNQIL